MSVPQWNADIITPASESGGTQVIGDNQEVQSTLESGTNITIEDGKISASGGGASYTAGTGIDIDHNEISIDNTVALKTDIPTKGSLMVKAGTTQKELYDAWAAGWTIQSNRGNEINVYELTHFEHEFGEYTAIFSRVYFADALIYEESFAIDGITDSTSAVSFGSKTTKTSNRVPAADSQTVGKVLTIKSVPDDDPIASWETPSSGTTYTAGTGIDISAQNAISIDTTTVATKNDLPSSSDLVPSSSSGDAGKVLTVDALGEPSWVTPSGGTTYSAGDGIDISAQNVVSADVDGTTIGIDLTTKKIKLLSTIPTVDQTYNAASTNAQSGVAVASAIAGKQDTISDLDTIRSGAAAGATAVQPSSLATVATTGSYNDLSNKPTIPTVDQNYNAASTNAQSGTAVAQAIAAIPSASYTAGDGIDIDNDEISVKAGNGLTIGNYSAPVTVTLSNTLFYDLSGQMCAVDLGQLTPDLLNQIKSNEGLTLTLSRNFYASNQYNYIGLAKPSQDNVAQCEYWVACASLSPTSGQMPSGSVITLRSSDYNSTVSNKTIADVEADLSNYKIAILTSNDYTYTVVGFGMSFIPSSSSVETAVTEVVKTTQNALNVSLGSVNSIQQVNALPANPDANTLYLIPEA